MLTVPTSLTQTALSPRVFLNDSGNLFGHACPNSSSVDNFVPVTSSDTAARSVDGSTLEVIGYGTVPPLLDKVAVIPALKGSLMSTKQLADNGITSIFMSKARGGDGILLNDHGDIVGRSDGSYRFAFPDMPCNFNIGAISKNTTETTSLNARDRVRLLQRKLKGWSKAEALRAAKYGTIANFPVTYRQVQKYWSQDPAHVAANLRRITPRQRPPDYDRGCPGETVYHDGFTVNPPASHYQYTRCDVYVCACTLYVLVTFGHSTDTAETYALNVRRVSQRYKLYNNKIKVLRQDSLPAQLAQEPEDAALEEEIRQEFRAPHQHEGHDERTIQTLKHMVTTMMEDAPWVPADCWCYAVLLAVALINLRLAPGDMHVTRYEAFTGISPDWLRMPLDQFGAPYIVLRENPDASDATFEAHGEPAAYLGPCPRSTYDVHYFLCIKSGRIIRRGIYRRLDKVPETWYTLNNKRQKKSLTIHLGTPVEVGTPQPDWTQLHDGLRLDDLRCLSAQPGENAALPVLTTEDIESRDLRRGEEREDEMPPAALPEGGVAPAVVDGQRSSVADAPSTLPQQQQQINALTDEYVQFMIAQCLPPAASDKLKPEVKLYFEKQFINLLDTFHQTNDPSVDFLLRNSQANDAPPTPPRTLRRRFIHALAKARKKIRRATNSDNPTLRQALQSPDADKWREAILKELLQMEKMRVFMVVDNVPVGCKVLPSHLVLKIKRLADGTFDKYKARLVGGGDHQDSTMYSVTSSATARPESVKMLFALAAKMGLHIRIFDVAGAYLLADIDRPIYMRIPSLNDGESPKIVKLLKSIYGLKQAGALWRKKIDESLRRLGCTPTSVDECVYVLEKDGERCYIALYVDDMLWATTSNELVEQCIAALAADLEADIEEVTHTGSHLGIRITHSDDGSITLSQPGYIAKIIDELDLHDAPTADTPERVGDNSYPDDSPLADVRHYQKVLGLLLFAATHTRPDIAHAVATLATFTSAPTLAHLEDAYRVARYLKGTADLGLTFTSSGTIELHAFVDASYNCHPDAKGHSGMLFSLGEFDAAVSHQSKKQNLVSRSSCEAEVYAVDAAVVHIEFLRALLLDLGYAQMKPTTVFQDNLSAIHVINADTYTARTKHFNMRFHYVKQAREAHQVILRYLPTEDHPADLLTKALSSAKQFYKLRARLLGCQNTPTGF